MQSGRTWNPLTCAYRSYHRGYRSPNRCSQRCSVQRQTSCDESIKDKVMDDDGAGRMIEVCKPGSCASRLEQLINVVSILPRLQRPTDAGHIFQKSGSWIVTDNLRKTNTTREAVLYNTGQRRAVGQQIRNNAHDINGTSGALKYFKASPVLLMKCGR